MNHPLRRSLILVVRSMSQTTESSHDSQMMLYQITVGDLAYFKSQQWALTNHSFLLFAAILGVHQLLSKSIAQWEIYGLALLAITVLVAAIILLNKLQDSIVVRQARLDAAREKLGFGFYTVWAAKGKSPEYIHAIYILRGAIIVGGTVVCWLLLRQSAI